MISAMEVVSEMTVPKKRKRYSKHSKKNQRKYTDVKDVEDFVREQGVATSEEHADSLFFLENAVRGGGASRGAGGRLRRSRTGAVRRSEANLLPNSTWNHGGPRTSRRASTSAKPVKSDSDGVHTSDSQEEVADLATSLVSSSEEDEYDFDASYARLRRTKERELRRKPSKLKPVVTHVQRDLWGEEKELTDRHSLPDEHYLKATRRKPVKRPVTLEVPPSAREAVELPLPGASYNPTFDDHQALLHAAVGVEEEKQREVDRVDKMLKLTPMTQHQREQVWQEEMMEGLEEHGGAKEEERDGEGSSGNEEAPPIKRPITAGSKKTLRQRRKERERKEEERRRLQKKIEKKRVLEVFRLKSIKKAIRGQEAAVGKRIAERYALKKEASFKTQRLGRHPYEEPDIDVQLSSELTGSLRSLKTEGNIADDRFKSLQRRNILETRHVVKPFRRYKLKVTEKRSARLPEDPNYPKKFK